MRQRQDFTRSDRVRKALMREVSDIIAHDIKDPLLTNVLISIIDVEVTPDLRYAKIFLSIMAEPTVQEAVISLLQEHQSKIRSEVGRRIRLRYTPEIELKLDNSLERGARVTQLIEQISRGEV